MIIFVNYAFPNIPLGSSMVSICRDGMLCLGQTNPSAEGVPLKIPVP